MFPSLKRNNDLASGIGSGISFRRLISDKRNGLIFPSRPNKKKNLRQIHQKYSVLFTIDKAEGFSFHFALTLDP